MADVQADTSPNTQHGLTRSGDAHNMDINTSRDVDNNMDNKNMLLSTHSNSNNGSSSNNNNTQNNNRHKAQNIPPWARRQNVDNLEPDPLDDHHSVASSAISNPLRGEHDGTEKWWTFAFPSALRNELARHSAHLPWTHKVPLTFPETNSSNIFDTANLRKNTNTNSRSNSSSHPRLPQSGWHSPWRPGSVSSTESSAVSHHHKTHLDTAALALKLQKRRLKRFLLKSGFAPLIFRFCNIAATTSLIAICGVIRMEERHNNVTGIFGFSPVLGMIFGSIGLVHCLLALRVEYSSALRIDGIHKLMHSLLDLVFICFFSALLALAFSNLYESPLSCANESRWWTNIPAQAPIILENPNAKQSLCRLCKALPAVTFIALFLYILNMIVTLLRVFDKINDSSLRAMEKIKTSTISRPNTFS